MHETYETCINHSPKIKCRASCGCVHVRASIKVTPQMNSRARKEENRTKNKLKSHLEDHYYIYNKKF